MGSLGGNALKLGIDHCTEEQTQNSAIFDITRLSMANQSAGFRSSAVSIRRGTNLIRVFSIVTYLYTTLRQSGDLLPLTERL